MRRASHAGNNIDARYEIIAADSEASCTNYTNSSYAIFPPVVLYASLYCVCVCKVHLYIGSLEKFEFFVCVLVGSGNAIINFFTSSRDTQTMN